MQYGKYLFSCEFQDDALLPAYKGSTFRGVFGHALKKVACALRRQDCDGCILRGQCIYARVFERPEGIDSQDRKRIATPPHPYVIEPPEDLKTQYRKEDPFQFTLLLFGKANEYLPYFVYAFDQIGKMGIGRQRATGRGAFALKRVTSGAETIYSGDTGRMCTGAFTRELNCLPAAGNGTSSVIKLVLRTPLRIKYENRLEADLPFHVLVRAMLRRVSSLLQNHGEGEPALDYRGMAARACDVEIAHSTLAWFDWKRFSSRQDQAMLLGGIVGDVTYTGRIDEFLPLIRFCEQVHLGKQTTFGLGRIALVEQ